MNKVVLIGRLTKDPDLRFAAGSGTAVTRLTLAVNRPFKKMRLTLLTVLHLEKLEK